MEMPTAAVDDMQFHVKGVFVTFDSEKSCQEALEHLPNSWLQKYLDMRSADFFRGINRFWVRKADVSAVMYV